MAAPAAAPAAEGPLPTVGAACIVAQRDGVVRFVGGTKFAAGVWVGIELLKGGGKNDGCVAGERYFECPANHGIFVRPASVTIAADASPKAKAEAKAKARASLIAEGKAPPMAKTASDGKAAAPAPAAAPAAVPAAPPPATNGAAAADPAAIAAKKEAAKDAARAQSAEKTAETITTLKAQLQQINQETRKRQSDIAAAETRANELEEKKKNLQDILGADEDMKALLEAEKALQRKQANLEKVRRVVEENKNQIKVLGRLKADLEAANANVDEKDLEKQLQEERLLTAQAQQKLEDAQSELLDLEIQLETDADDRAQALFNDEKAIPEKVVAYQEAIRIFGDAATKEVEEVQRHIAELNQFSSGVSSLKLDAEELRRETEALEEKVATLEVRKGELVELLSADNELEKATSDVEKELQEDIKLMNKRMSLLEDLIKKLQAEWKATETGITSAKRSEEDLLQQICKVAPGVSQLDKDRRGVCTLRCRAAMGSLQKPFLKLEALATSNRESAFQSFYPKGWLATKEAPSSKPSVAKVVTFTTSVSMVEHCLWRCDALAAHVCFSRLGPLAKGSSEARGHYDLVRASCRCMAAAALAVQALQLGSLDELSAGIEAFSAAAKADESEFSKALQAAASSGTVDAAALFGPAGKLEEHLKALASSVSSEKQHRGAHLLVAVTVVRRLEAAYRYLSVTEVKDANEEPPPAAEEEAPKEEEKPAEEEAPTGLAALRALQSQAKSMEAKPAEPAAPTGLAALRELQSQARGMGGAGGEEQPAAPAAPKEPEGPPPPPPPHIRWKGLFSSLAKLSVLLRECGQALISDLPLEDEGEQVDPVLPLFFTELLEEFEAAVEGGKAPTTEMLERFEKKSSRLLSAIVLIESRLSPAKRIGYKRYPTLFGWAKCCKEVQEDFAKVCASNDTIAEIEAKTAEEQKHLNVARGKSAETSKRIAQLEKELSEVTAKAETARNLKQEVDTLRAELLPMIADQASLNRTLEEMMIQREQQDKQLQQSETMKQKLQDDLRAKRGRPQDCDGQATIPELVTLRATRKKYGRELFELQVQGLNELTPLPDVTSSKNQTPWQTSLQGYVELKRDTLRQMTSFRIGSLDSVFPVDPLGPLQQMRLELATLKKSLEPLAATIPAPKVEQKTSEPMVSVNLGLTKPSWSFSKGGAFPISFSKLCDIHKALV